MSEGLCFPSEARQVEAQQGSTRMQLFSHQQIHLPLRWGASVQGRLAPKPFHVLPSTSKHACASARQAYELRQGKERPITERQSKSGKDAVLNVRLLAVQQLLRIEQEGAFAGLLNGSPQRIAPDVASSNLTQNDGLDTEIDSDTELISGVGSAPKQLEPQQQRTLKNLVSGVTRWQRRLDCIMSRLLSRSSSDLDPGVRQVLRVALYELLFVRLAPHALGEFVNVTRMLGYDRATSLVNVALRNASRHLKEGSLPDPEADLKEGNQLSGRELVKALSLAYSHPNWMVSQWLKRWGKEATIQLLQHNNRPPAYILRVNTLSGASLQSLQQQLQDLEGVIVEPNHLLPSEFLTVTSGLQRILAEGYVSDGRCCVQDVAAGLVVALALNPQPGEQLLDCTAAPGGKAIYSAARMQAKGHITALDVSPARVSAMEKSAAACNIPPECFSTHAANVLTWAPEQVAAGRVWDKVLLDAPCSGTGVLAKRADLRWRRTPQDIQHLVQLQASMLDAVAPLVKPGGVLVYSTCSIESNENQQQVLAFLDRHPEFEMQGISAKEAEVQGIPSSVVNEQGCLEVLPHMHGGVDGAFAARFVRRYHHQANSNPDQAFTTLV